MARTLFLLGLLLFSVLQAQVQTPNLFNTWSYTIGNPLADTYSWRLPYWKFIGDKNSITFPSPFFAHTAGISSPDSDLESMWNNFLDWEIVTLDLADVPIHIDLPIIDDIKRMFQETVPIAVFYNSKEHYLRVIGVNLMFLLISQNVPNIDASLFNDLVGELGLDENFPQVDSGEYWFGTSYNIRLSDPLNARIAIATNSNTGNLSCVGRDSSYIYALDRRNPSIFDNYWTQISLSGKRYYYYADFSVAYDDILPFPNSELTFCISFELRASGDVTLLWFIKMRPSLKFRANTIDHIISLPGVKTPSDPDINKPFYNVALGGITMRNSAVFDVCFSNHICTYHSNTGCAPNHYYKLTTLPSGFALNPILGLNSQPSNLHYSLKFTVRQRRDNTNAHPISGLLNNPFFQLVSERTTSTYNYYDFETHFVEPEMLKDFVIFTRASEITDLKVKVRATFSYLENPSATPYLYQAVYSPIVNPKFHNQQGWGMTMNYITSNQTINTVHPNAKYIITNGATLTINNVSFNSNDGIYAFVVDNGKIIFNNCSFLTNVDFLRISNPQSEIVIQNSPNSNNSIREIRIENGAKLSVINNSRLNVLTGRILLSGANTQIEKSPQSRYR
jgi:hypothetical protein